MPTPNIPADFDFLDPDVDLVGLPVAELAELRKSEQIHWVDVPSGCGGFEHKGYWIVTKHADVKEVSKRNDVFSSWQNGAIPVWPKEMTREAVELQRSVMLNMDAVVLRNAEEAGDRLQRELARHLLDEVAGPFRRSGLGDVLRPLVELVLQSSDRAWCEPAGDDLAQPGVVRRSPIRTRSTSCATPIRTSVSVALARTIASERTWRG